MDGNVITVATDSGETKVNLGADSTIQLFELGTPSGLSTGDRVLVIASGVAETETRPKAPGFLGAEGLNLNDSGAGRGTLSRPARSS